MSSVFWNPLGANAAHLPELCDFLDLDGNLLIKNDACVGITTDKGNLSFANAPEQLGLRVKEEGILLDQISQRVFKKLMALLSHCNEATLETIKPSNK